MEALAAVSLAGNILQFVGAAGRVVCKTWEYYGSASGSLRENEDSAAITSNLKDLSEKLKTAPPSSDAALDDLCNRCQEAASDLLAALDKLAIKGKASKSQSIRKALKAIWGKEKLQSQETRLCNLREELNLHVTVQLRIQLEALRVQSSDDIQKLERNQDQGIQRILAALGSGVHAFSIELGPQLEAQTDTIRQLHEQTREVISQRIDQSDSTNEILNAIQDASRAQQIREENIGSSVTDHVSNESSSTRKHIDTTLEKNYERMKSDIVGLEKGLKHLQIEIDARASELKELILRIGTTREDEERRRLTERGNSVHLMLMSLHALFDSLQELLQPLLQSAKRAFGSFKTANLAPLSKTSPSQELVEDSPGSFSTATALEIYYGYYYKSLFDGYVGSKNKIQPFEWIHVSQWVKNLPSNAADLPEQSPEHLALWELLKNSNKTAWALVILSNAVRAQVHGYQCCLEVIATAFSLRCSDHSDNTTSDPYGRVLACFPLDSNPTVPQGRYSQDTILGDRLRHDIGLWLSFGKFCGLQEVLPSLLSGNAISSNEMSGNNLNRQSMVYMAYLIVSLPNAHRIWVSIASKAADESLVWRLARVEHKEYYVGSSIEYRFKDRFRSSFTAGNSDYPSNRWPFGYRDEDHFRSSSVEGNSDYPSTRWPLIPLILGYLSDTIVDLTSGTHEGQMQKIREHLNRIFPPDHPVRIVNSDKELKTILEQIERRHRPADSMALFQVAEPVVES